MLHIQLAIKCTFHHIILEGTRSFKSNQIRIKSSCGQISGFLGDFFYILTIKGLVVSWLWKFGHPRLIPDQVENWEDFRTVYIFHRFRPIREILLKYSLKCLKFKLIWKMVIKESPNQIWEEFNENYNFYCLSTKIGNGQKDRWSLAIATCISPYITRNEGLKYYLGDLWFVYLRFFTFSVILSCIRVQP